MGKADRVLTPQDRFLARITAARRGEARPLEIAGLSNGPDVTLAEIQGAAAAEQLMTSNVRATDTRPVLGAVKQRWAGTRCCPSATVRHQPGAPSSLFGPRCQRNAPQKGQRELTVEVPFAAAGAGRPSGPTLMAYEHGPPLETERAPCG